MYSILRPFVQMGAKAMDGGGAFGKWRAALRFEPTLRYFDATYLEEPDYGHGMFDFKEAREKILAWFLERSAGKQH